MSSMGSVYEDDNVRRAIRESVSTWRSPDEHTHQCRDCGSTIVHDDEPCNWPGGNVDCYCVTDEEEENQK